MPTLYRCNTPTDWLCPCGRVARALDHAEIAFDEIKLPQTRTKRPEVEALTDQQRVPVLVIDGQAICDSRRILQYLEYRRTTADDDDADPPGSRTQARREPLWQ